MWKDQVIAESDQTVVVEGNHYFPPDSVKREFLRDSAHTGTCVWKGEARYYTVVADGEENPNAAWYYPDPKPAVEHIKGRIAFWKGVKVS